MEPISHFHTLEELIRALLLRQEHLQLPHGADTRRGFPRLRQCPQHPPNQLLPPHHLQRLRLPLHLSAEQGRQVADRGASAGGEAGGVS